MRSNVVKLPKRIALICPQCNAEGSGSCDCGVPYIPAGVRAAQAIAENPEKSDRAIAAEIGVNHNTVSRARSTVSKETVGKRVGKDGKARKLPKPKAARSETVERFLRELGEFQDDFSLRLQQWLDGNPPLDADAKHALVHMLQTYSLQLGRLAQMISERR